MKKTLCFAVISLMTIVAALAQYKQPERDYSALIQAVFPTAPFDSLAAKNALAPGRATIKGILYDKRLDPKMGLGENFKTIYLFPGTPYFEEWYHSKLKRAKIKKGVLYVAAIDSAAFNYNYWCETNLAGEFTFPNLKPGKYILFVTVDKVATRTYDRYTGSGYNSDGGQTDYYAREQYANSFKSDLVKEIEIKQDDQIVDVNWKK